MLYQENLLKNISQSFHNYVKSFDGQNVYNRRTWNGVLTMTELPAHVGIRRVAPGSPLAVWITTVVRRVTQTGI